MKRKITLNAQQIKQIGDIPPGAGRALDCRGGDKKDIPYA